MVTNKLLGSQMETPRSKKYAPENDLPEIEGATIQKIKVDSPEGLILLLRTLQKIVNEHTVAILDMERAFGLMLKDMDLLVGHLERLNGTAPDLVGLEGLSAGKTPKVD